ncbi:MAG TPA: DUF5661 family protein [Solirubrobacteraceae bacterium]|nr:DUF5661 family protein [Solirubrobacteraceae bacterium]
MSDTGLFSTDDARAAGERIGIDWATSPFDVEQFRTGMDVELEHGTQDLETNVTDDDVTVTAKIARAHLNEFPDYYTRLAVMEAEAEEYWARREQATVLRGVGREPQRGRDSIKRPNSTTASGTPRAD